MYGQFQELSEREQILNRNLLAERLADEYLQGSIFSTEGILYRGYFTPALTTSEDYTIQQPGDAKVLLGLNIISVAPAGALPVAQTCSLTINSNNAIQNVPLLALCPQGPNGIINAGRPYFPLNRLMSGNDQIKFTINSATAIDLYLVIYYK